MFVTLQLAFLPSQIQAQTLGQPNRMCIHAEALSIIQSDHRLICSVHYEKGAVEVIGLRLGFNEQRFKVFWRRGRRMEITRRYIGLHTTLIHWPLSHLIQLKTMAWNFSQPGKY